MRTLSVLLLLTAMITAPSAQATVHVRLPIEVSTDLSEWITEILDSTSLYNNGVSEPSAGFTECAAVSEIQHTFVCASYRQSTMNQIFARATYFFEQHAKILPLNSDTYKNLVRTMGGHDLHSHDLISFYATLNSACVDSKNDKQICPTPAEREMFEKFLIPASVIDPSFTIIAFGVLSEADSENVVSHEMMHAQYFNEPAYAQAVDDFWANDMTLKDKDKVRKLLSQTYDSTNDALMRNEFQAYILMPNANRNMLGPLVSKYRKKLLQKLKEGGVEPIQVE